jgi:hypothetical protein
MVCEEDGAQAPSSSRVQVVAMVERASVTLGVTFTGGSCDGGAPNRGCHRRTERRGGGLAI